MKGKVSSMELLYFLWFLPHEAVEGVSNNKKKRKVCLLVPVFFFIFPGKFSREPPLHALELVFMIRLSLASQVAHYCQSLSQLL